MGQSKKTNFRWTGQFLGYELKDHRIHRVHFKQDNEEYQLKLSSEARSFLVRAYLEKTLEVGDWLEVEGVKKETPKKGVRWKAKIFSHCKQAPNQSQEPISPKPAKTKVLVCQKSGCCKRGGKAVLKELEKMVGDRHLDHQVSIKRTGCMGKCSQGPVMVIDRTHYRQVDANKIPHLIEHHIHH